MLWTKADLKQNIISKRRYLPAAYFYGRALLLLALDVQYITPPTFLR